MDDLLLLKQYVADRSPAAFAALVDRYGNLVHAAAQRHIGDRHLAEDVVQAVFVVLAQRAATIPPGRAVGAWLLTTTRFVALNERRLRARAAARERRVPQMTPANETSTDPADAAQWAALGPMVDEGLARLSPNDRDALVWRFFEGESIAAVAQRSGISEEAARKRLARALERLRRFFRARGVVAEDVVPSLALLGVAGAPVPGAIRDAILHAALTPIGGSSAVIAKGAVTLMAAQKVKAMIAIVVAALLLSGTGIVGVATLTRTPARRTVTVPPPASAPATPARAMTGGRLPTVFVNGVHAQLAGARHYYGEWSWWGADGAAVPAVGEEVDLSLGGFETDDRRAIEFRVRLAGEAPLGNDYRIRLPGIATGGATWAVPDGTGGATFLAVVSVPRAAREAPVELGVASGPWQTFDALTPAGAATRPAVAAAEMERPTTRAKTLRIKSMTEVDGKGKTEVEFMDRRDWPEWGETGWRAVVITKNKRTLRYSDVNYPDQRMIFTFDVPMRDIDHAAYQIRPIEWASLGTVPLYPATQPASSAASSAP